MRHPQRSIRAARIVQVALAALALATGGWSSASRAQSSLAAAAKAPVAHTALNPQPLPPAETIDRTIARPVVGQKTGIIIVGGAPVAAPTKVGKPVGPATAKPKRVQDAP